MIEHGFEGTIFTRSGQRVDVRRVKEGDTGYIRTFFEDLSEKTRTVFTPHRYTDNVIEKHIGRVTSGRDFSYIALCEKRCIGYFFLWRIDLAVPLLGIGIADAYQGTGLGQQFMDILIADAKALQKDGIELTTVLTNQRAFELYQKKGFLYLGDVENIDGKGTSNLERSMFLPLKDGAQAPKESHHNYEE